MMGLLYLFENQIKCRPVANKSMLDYKKFNGGVGEIFFTCFILIIFYKQSESMGLFGKKLLLDL